MDPALTEVIATSFATFFVIIDPLGLTPMFLALTAHMTLRERRRTAVRAVILSFSILLLFALFGKSVLSFLGISLPAFRIAGGILLFIMALEMLFEKRTERRRKNVENATHEHEETADSTDDLWVFPLGIPLISGPGAITSVILLMGEHAGRPLEQALVIGVMTVVLLSTLILFLLVTQLGHFMSETATRAISRLLGMILAALAVQFVLTGLKSAGLAP